MTKTSKLFLIRHAPVEKRKGLIPKNNPNALINSKHIKYLASQIPDNSFCYISPLKRTVQTAEALSKYINFKFLSFSDAIQGAHLPHLYSFKLIPALIFKFPYLSLAFSIAYYFYLL